MGASRSTKQEKLHSKNNLKYLKDLKQARTLTGVMGEDSGDRRWWGVAGRGGRVCPPRRDQPPQQGRVSKNNLFH